MSARDLTRDGLVRALAAAVSGSAGVAGALQSRAAVLAERARAMGLEARIAPRGAGRCAVLLSGPGLFASAHGSRDALPDKAIPEIIGERP